MQRVALLALILHESSGLGHKSCAIQAQAGRGLHDLLLPLWACDTAQMTAHTLEVPERQAQVSSEVQPRPHPLHGLDNAFQRLSSQINETAASDLAKRGACCLWAAPDRAVPLRPAESLSP